MTAAPTGVLAEIIQSTREEVAARKSAHPLDSLRHELAEQDPRARRLTGRFAAALDPPGIGVIAEFKRRSPSAGALREGADVTDVVRAYERGGACALSVLTEGPHFEGSLADLREARSASGLPILRKDFIVDPYQLYEARLASADAVLLIVAALDRAELEALHRQARELGLDVLVEVHDPSELQLALALDGAVLGINNRDLRDFSVDVERTARLMEHVPAHARVVSESGIAHAGQLATLERAGVAAVLVGESLMRAHDPQAALAALANPAAPTSPGAQAGARQSPANL